MIFNFLGGRGEKGRERDRRGWSLEEKEKERGNERGNEKRGRKGGSEGYCYYLFFFLFKSLKWIFIYFFTQKKPSTEERREKVGGGRKRWREREKGGERENTPKKIHFI